VTDKAGGLDLQSRAILLIDVVDINDNEPVFEKEQYNLLLKSDSGIGSSIAKIVAVDADIREENNGIMYFLKTGGEGKFKIDVFTGNCSSIITHVVLSFTGARLK
jgi:hypothetical protein